GTFWPHRQGAPACFTFIITSRERPATGKARHMSVKSALALLGLTMLALIAACVVSSAAAAVHQPGSTTHLDPEYGCQFGYRQQGDSCVVVVVPVHAYLNSSGDDWHCNRGFQRAAERCVPIVVPRNAHLSN